jgi:SnoaL-like domain
MAIHAEFSPSEATDRLALRELFDEYAHCADRRDAEGQKALFTDDTVFAVYMDGEGSEPTYVLHGREALTPVFVNAWHAPSRIPVRLRREARGDNPRLSLVQGRSLGRARMCAVSLPRKRNVR